MLKQTWRKRKCKTTNSTEKYKTETEKKPKYAKGSEEKKYLKSSQANIYNSKSLWRWHTYTNRRGKSEGEMEQVKSAIKEATMVHSKKITHLIKFFLGKFAKQC